MQPARLCWESGVDESLDQWSIGEASTEDHVADSRHVSEGWCAHMDPARMHFPRDVVHGFAEGRFDGMKAVPVIEFSLPSQIYTLEAEIS